jgi:putative transposase
MLCARAIIMSRKKIDYLPHAVYHCVARTNNKEPFHSLPDTWRIFSRELSFISKHYGVTIFAFVLMSNHYHLLLKVGDKIPLGRVMNYFQAKLSRTLNLRNQRINHVFGGQYRGSRITECSHFDVVFRYVLQNPLKANLCTDVRAYEYSTAYSYYLKAPKRFPFSVNIFNEPLADNILKRINEGRLFEWLNTPNFSDRDKVTAALRRSNFKLPKNRRNRKIISLT